MSQSSKSTKSNQVKQPPCFIPLSLTSQCGHEHVLYYNANAPLDEIFECATARLQAVINLLECLYEFNQQDENTLYAVASVTTLLLSDARTLLEELNPMANHLKNSSQSTQ